MRFINETTSYLNLLEINVSRETVEKLSHFLEELLRWNATKNLISKSDEQQVVLRHLVDSLTLFPLLPSFQERMVDIGSGNGFPGIIMAIMGVKNLTLIERNQRKSAFLRYIAATLEIEVQVLTQDFKHSLAPAQVISARAVDSVIGLLNNTYSLRSQKTQYFFFKGKNHEKEIIEAEKKYTFLIKKHFSSLSAESIILQLSHIKSK